MPKNYIFYLRNRNEHIMNNRNTVISDDKKSIKTILTLNKEQIDYCTKGNPEINLFIINNDKLMKYYRAEVIDYTTTFGNPDNEILFSFSLEEPLDEMFFDFGLIEKLNPIASVPVIDENGNIKTVRD